MRATVLRIAIISISILILFDFTACAYDNGDFQIWHTENQDLKIDKAARLGLEEEFRFGGGASELYYQHYDAGLFYDVNKNFTLGINYRQVWELKNGKFRPEYRPHANAIVKYEFWNFRLEDRNRFEYRIFNYQDNIVEYRNKFTVKLSCKSMPFELQPYLADEIFINLNDVIMRRNRLYAGISFTPVKHLKGELYYLLQSDNKPRGWINANVLGTKLRLEF